MSLDGSRAQYYRSRADEVRKIAMMCRDLAVKAQLETVAKEFEALASLVDRGLIAP